MPPWVEREVVASYLLDVAGAWEWLSGQGSAGLRRVPEGVRALSAADEDKLSMPEAVPAEPAVPERIAWVRTQAELEAAVAELMREPVVGLDVETTLRTRTLCLVQIARPERTYLIDALEVSDLEALRPLLESTETQKIIHNAVFERGVLGRLGFTIEGVIDTLVISRELRGRKVEGGHGLRAVCARELGMELDKSEQTSNWARRPLTPSQVAYAALDAEVLLRIWGVFAEVMP